MAGRWSMSIARRALVCLVAVLVVGTGAVGVVAATGGSSALVTDTDGETTDTGVLEGSVAVTTGDLEDDVDDTSDDLEEDSENTTEELENDVDNTTDGLDGTSDELEDGVDDTTDDIEDGVDTTTDDLEETTDRLGPSTAVDLEAAANASVGTQSDDGTDESDASDEASSTGDQSDDDSDDAGPPSGTAAAADAVLVGLLGAITASGAAAGGASGAAGGASGLAANLASQPGVRHLRRAGSVLPWELGPILGYSRYDDSDPLENDRRRAIYETIAADPGCYLTELSDRTDVSLSTVRHHVRILEEEGLVTTAKVNGKRRYFFAGGGERGAATTAAGPTDPEDIERHAALAEPAKREVLEALADLGPVPNGRLADELERDPSTVSHHLSALSDDGLVVRERDGRAMVNELAPEVESVLSEAESSLEDESAEPSVPADD